MTSIGSRTFSGGHVFTYSVYVLFTQFQNFIETNNLFQESYYSFDCIYPGSQYKTTNSLLLTINNY